MTVIDFTTDCIRETDDSWREYTVPHEQGGLHHLYLRYATEVSRPCRIRIGSNHNIWVSIALETGTSSADGFHDEGIFDLGPLPGKTVVGFRPVVGNTFPDIRAFYFTPVESSADDLPFSAARGGVTGESSRRWIASPTPVTFTFEIGVPLTTLARETHEVEYLETYLPGKAIKFIFGEAHDAISIDGDPIGSQHGGDSFPKVTFVDEDDTISSVTLGLSTWNREGAFTGLVLEKRRGTFSSDATSVSLSRKRVLVGASLVQDATCAPWTFDCHKLGLNLSITSLAAPRHKPVARYGFTLSSSSSLKFNPDEFGRFWEWLVRVKHRMMLARRDRTQNRTVDNIADGTTLDALRLQMEKQRQFYQACFSGSPWNHDLDAYLYGTRRHVHVVFDAFSIYISRLPDGETFHAVLFMDGKQYNTQTSRMEEISLFRNDVLAFAISVALQDKDLLFQMGLIRPYCNHASEQHFQEDDVGLDEVEFLPLKKETALFTGDFSNPVMARRAVTLLALAGLRKVSFETVMTDRDGFDIYDLASVTAPGMYSVGRKSSIELGAVCCCLLQTVVPVLLILRGVQQEIHDIAWEVYLARFCFGSYAIFYEAKTWEVDNGDRVTAWLAFLPEFDETRLVVGLLVNKIAKVTVAFAIVVLMIRSTTVFDVTLNALALYFIQDVDDELVDNRTLEEHIVRQRREMFTLKSKIALEYQLPSFKESDLPQVKNLPSKYFAIASNHVSSSVVVMLVFGCLWMIVEPFVLGWKFTT